MDQWAAPRTSLSAILQRPVLPPEIADLRVDAAVER